MPLPILAMAGSALASMASGYANSVIQERFNMNAEDREQHRYLQNLALQRQYNLEDWNRQNEYNSPLAEKNRLIEAGYSPYAKFSGGANAALQGATLNAPKSTAPVFSPSSQMFTIMQELENIKLQKSQSEKIEQETNLLSTQNTVESQTAMQKRSAEISNMTQDVLNKQANEKYTVQNVENLKGSLTNLLQDVALKEIEKTYKSDILSTNVQLQKAQLKNVAANTERLRYEIESLQLRNRYDSESFRSRVDELKSRIVGMKLDNELKRIENLYRGSEKWDAQQMRRWQLKDAEQMRGFEQNLPAWLRYGVDKIGGSTLFNSAIRN